MIIVINITFSIIQVSRKLKVQDSEIEWSGVAWICAKQLKHYPAFCRSETAIKVSNNPITHSAMLLIIYLYSGGRLLV